MSGALHPDRLFASDPVRREIARELYGEVARLPLVCPHTHVDAARFATNAPFEDPATLFVTSDHYLLRMLYSQGVPLEDLGVAPRDGNRQAAKPREVWRTFARHWPLFRGTPSRLWLEYQLVEVFGVRESLSETTADAIYDRIEERLRMPEYAPRALYERFNIEVLATTDAAGDPLDHHRAIRDSGWGQRVVPTFRPDDVVDMEQPGWREAVERLGRLTDVDTLTYDGYIAALERRRAEFRALGATATDHGHPTALALALSPHEARGLYEQGLRGDADAAAAERFRAHMLMEFARMSADDGLVMQLHVGSRRNHHRALYERFGPDIGADIPRPTDYVNGLAPLLNRYGADPRLRLVVFTLDESTYSRELAPLAGHYPALRLGPPWWFFDSPAGIRRYRALTTETAGFRNTAGFNDDARSFTSIPARHDLARRVDCDYLAQLVAEHQLDLEEAREVAVQLAYGLAKDTYRL